MFKTETSMPGGLGNGSTAMRPECAGVESQEVRPERNPEHRGHCWFLQISF